MSMIDLEGAVAASDVIDTLTEAGATVIWSGDKPSQSKVLRITTSVDIETAAEAIPSMYFANDDDDEWVEPDAFDVVDFIAACQANDCLSALALLRRLNLSEGSLDRGERYLVEHGAARARGRLV